ncbi:MAG: type IV secretion protein IcmD [Legionellaceae bacterium]|nr:type IV secretion protein IcmD [Legionellaceae bacterium]
MKNKNKKLNRAKSALAVAALGLLVVSTGASAATLGNMASSVTSSFGALTKLITAASYLAGLGFAIGAIMKFKAHKDNPTQITVGTPIALVFIAASLLFLPSILDMAGSTMFGDEKSVSGSAGQEYGG